jgi:hypothetical protein
MFNYVSRLPMHLYRFTAWHYNSYHGYTHKWIVLKGDITCVYGERDSVMVEALCYNPEGRGFKTRRGEWIFSIYLILPVALGPGVYSTSNRNEGPCRGDEELEGATASVQYSRGTGHKYWLKARIFCFRNFSQIFLWKLQYRTLNFVTTVQLDIICNLTLNFLLNI